MEGRWEPSSFILAQIGHFGTPQNRLSGDTPVRDCSQIMSAAVEGLNKFDKHCMAKEGMEDQPNTDNDDGGVRVLKN